MTDIRATGPDSCPPAADGGFRRRLLYKYVTTRFETHIAYSNMSLFPNGDRYAIAQPLWWESPSGQLRTGRQIAGLSVHPPLTDFGRKATCRAFETMADQPAGAESIADL